eukprot:364774-Chlamydomonas_euryale.AAC.14
MRLMILAPHATSQISSMQSRPFGTSWMGLHLLMRQASLVQMAEITKCFQPSIWLAWFRCNCQYLRTRAHVLMQGSERRCNL